MLGLFDFIPTLPVLVYGQDLGFVSSDWSQRLLLFLIWSSMVSCLNLCAC